MFASVQPLTDSSLTLLHSFHHLHLIILHAHVTC